MSIEQAFAACEETVKRFDPDRYWASLFAPPEKRPLLFALYAFNHEIARVTEAVREPMLGTIRLQWWRDAMTEAREGRPRTHDVVRAMAAAFARTRLPEEPFERMLAARELDAGAELFADMAALEIYADATSGTLMRLAAIVLGEDIGDGARDIGIAYALTGLLRAIPYHAARNKTYLPLDLLAAEKLSPEDIFAGQGGDKLKTVMKRIAQHAREKLASARRFSIPSAAFPAVLPASVSKAYLGQLTGAGFDPFRDRAELPLWRRQIAMVRANLTGRI
ncbi:MAG TPA: phytoene/squalene synthase family protein [Rhizomicrobium sp.]|nr:phytoene/squalene synthase family protein [Rhizomicrobium sp.]